MLAIIAAAFPFAFALIRAFETGGRDLRYIWVALAASIGATVVVSTARAYRSGPIAALALAAAVLVISTLLAIVAAWLLGTVLGLGVFVVGSAFGLCFAVASLFHTLARA